MTAAADARAKALAAPIEALMREGYVGSPELATALADRMGHTFTPRQIRTILDRLKRLGLITVKPAGPYADKAYSPLPRQRNTQASREALRAHADEWALAMKPAIDALASCGILKPLAVAPELERRGISTERGGSWTESIVKHLLARLLDIRERSQRR